MTTVALAPTGVLGFPDGGGHWWVYLQYVRGLTDLGCDVWWVERLPPDRPPPPRTALRRLERLGLAGRILAYRAGPDGTPAGWLAGSARRFTRLTTRADLLLNFDYRLPPAVVGSFGRSALVDLDPGLLQQWIAFGQLTPARHDRWFTTGETVGTDRARFPDGGVPWHRIRPVVHLPSWPVCPPPPREASWTTVTSWWGDEWISDGAGLLYENNKRVTFLEYAEVPRRSGRSLELAGYFGDSRTGPTVAGREVEPDEAAGDREDVRRMRRGGWRLRRSAEVAGDPWAYRRYIQGSRGEFSCAKPSCMVLQNAWVSDRTLCYLASGRPAVVQDTGPSGLLPDGEGLVRFSSPEEAVDALHRVEDRHRRHRAAARGIAESLFDSTSVLPGLLDTALSGSSGRPATSAERPVPGRTGSGDRGGG